MIPVPAAEWANFFIAEVGAAAALTGLVVVAISINLSRILAIDTLLARAGEALVILAGVLVLTSIGLVPGQSGTAFGAETAAAGVLMFLISGILQWRAPTDRRVLWWRRSLRPVISAAASLPIIEGGALLLLGSASGLYWIAAGVIVSLLAGIFTAWVLLIEIMR
jgi:hypothetical protein